MNVVVISVDNTEPIWLVDLDPDTQIPLLVGDNPTIINLEGYIAFADVEQNEWNGRASTLFRTLGWDCELNEGVIGQVVLVALSPKDEHVPTPDNLIKHLKAIYGSFMVQKGTLA